MAATKAALAYAFALLGVLVVIAPSAFDDDADLKKQANQIASLCVEISNKQDAAGVAALFAKLVAVEWLIPLTPETRKRPCCSAKSSWGRWKAMTPHPAAIRPLRLACLDLRRKAQPRSACSRPPTRT